ncbi:MAG: S10 family serine carboxypeptidase-like protein, partial [Gammaproteobacteria bacterium]
MKRIIVLLSLFLVCGSVITAFADDAPAANAKSADKSLPVPKETSSITHHSVNIDGVAVRYTATAGNLVIDNDKGDAIGSFFYVAYTKDGVTDTRHRPLTFLFNGGPGSSSIWLHMGSFGPMRVETTDADVTPPAPYKLVSNPYSLLDK